VNLFRDPAKARERAGLTQEALAKKIGTNAQRGLPLRTPPDKFHALDIGKGRPRDGSQTGGEAGLTGAEGGNSFGRGCRAW